MKHLLILTVPLTLALECPKGENLRKKSKREKFCEGETHVGEKERCHCKKDLNGDLWVRTKPGGECVKDCTAWIESIPTCESNKIWHECAVCFQDCGEPERCMGLLIDGECPGGCQCPDETQWHADKKMCVPDSECPEQPCPWNSSWKCMSSCESTCQNPLEEDSMCVFVQCDNRCECNEGYVKDEKSGECLEEDKCPVSICPRNSVWDDCGSACPETCQKHGEHGGHPGDTPHGNHGAHLNDNPHGEHGSHTSPCTEQCVPSCVCLDDFVLNDEGECIAKAECPVSCPANSTWNDCGSSCPETCQKHSEHGGHPGDEPHGAHGAHPENDPHGEHGSHLACTMQCNPSCACDRGFVLNDNGECITKDECPQTCGDNQEWVECPLCSQKCGEPELCIMMDMCPFGEECGCPLDSKCMCMDGFQEDPEDPSKCVPDSMCGECAVNEVWNNCSSACEITCQNQFSPVDVCTMQCVHKCDCKFGFLRDERTGKCVSSKQCPIAQCPENEMWNTCQKMEEETCDPATHHEHQHRRRRYAGEISDTHGEHGAHPKNDPHGPHGGHRNNDPHGPHGAHPVEDVKPVCAKQGCECKHGYVRHEGTCIKETTCPCPTNENYKECAFDCGPQCSFPAPFCSLGAGCIAGCQCDDGFKRDREGTCHEAKQCQTEACGRNEHWKMCGTKCEATCILPNPTCTKECVDAKCECLPDFVRNESGACIPVSECPVQQILCGENSDVNMLTNECDCFEGYQKHDDGRCYAFLNLGSKVCNTADIPFMAHFIAKRCPESIKVSKKCKIQCKLDKKSRSKKLPKTMMLYCKQAINANGKVIGAEFDYRNGYVFENMCGKGCDLQMLRDTKFMGPSAEAIPSTKNGAAICELNEDGLIPFDKCKMRCKKANDHDAWANPKKPFVCECKDNETADKRVCQWRFLNSATPSKAFDKKFWLAQTNGSALKCTATEVSNKHGEHGGHPNNDPHGPHGGHLDNDPHGAHGGHSDTEVNTTHGDHEGHPNNDPHGPHGGHINNDPHGPHGGHSATEDSTTHGDHEGHPNNDPHGPHGGHINNDPHGEHGGHSATEVNDMVNGMVSDIVSDIVNDMVTEHGLHGGHPNNDPHGPHGGHADNNPHGAHGSH